MGVLLNITKSRYVRDTTSKGYGYKRISLHNGLNLSHNGWNIFNLVKHRRGWYNKCSVCGGKCCQSFGGQYDIVCIKCSSEWFKNSIEEIAKIKTKIKEKQKLIKKDYDKIMKFEKKKIDTWEKMDILDKLENEQ